MIPSISHSLYPADTDTEHVAANQVSKPRMGRSRQGGQASSPCEVFVGFSLRGFSFSGFQQQTLAYVRGSILSIPQRGVSLNRKGPDTLSPTSLSRDARKAPTRAPQLLNLDSSAPRSARTCLVLVSDLGNCRGQGIIYGPMRPLNMDSLQSSYVPNMQYLCCDCPCPCDYSVPGTCIVLPVASSPKT